MVSRHVTWVVSLPLAVASWLGAHCLAYWLVSPGGEHRMGLHAEHGHAYLGYAPAIGLLGLAFVLAGVVLCVGEGLRGRRPSRPPLRLFALLPPVGFAVQEHLERLIGSGAVPYDLLVEPTFLVGLALQLPFALAALLLASALHSLALGLGAALARGVAFPRPVRCAPPLLLPLPAPPFFLAPSVLALGHGQRAPPAIGRS
jgi:hypothetical protein